MSLWLMNLVRLYIRASVLTPGADLDQLVAVITSSFQVIREESRASAFTTDEQ